MLIVPYDTTKLLTWQLPKEPSPEPVLLGRIGSRKSAFLAAHVGGEDTLVFCAIGSGKRNHAFNPEWAVRDSV